jgi:hypothetical protein
MLRFGRHAGLLAVGALLAACAATSRSGELEPRFFAVHNALAAMGLAQVGPIQRGALAAGAETRVPIELAAGCTTVVAIGAEGVRDLDAALLDPDGTPVAHDTTKDAQAVVRACVHRSGTYLLAVKMSEGAGDFLAATWSGGIEAPAASTTGETAVAAAGAPAGTCEAPIPITAGTYTGSTSRGESENEATCASSTSHEIVYRLDVAARQRVTLDVDPRFDSVLYVRKDDCAEAEAEVACNDDVGHERRSRIDEVLDPGTYFVFVDGLANEVGQFRFKVALEDVPTIAEVCRGARPLVSGIPANGTTDAAFDSAESTCGEGAKGPDVAYRLDLAARARVRVSMHSSDVAPVVHLRRTCADEQTELACSDEGMSDEDATYTGVLEPGSYAVFADATVRDSQGGNGRFLLLAETAPEQGTGTPGDACGDALPIVKSGRIEGDTFVARDDVAGTCGGAGAADAVYRLDVAHRSRFGARFTKQEGRHVFVLTRACGDRAGEVACGASVDQVLVPGTYWLAVDGVAPKELGRYAFEARLRDVAAQEAACKTAPLLRPGTMVNGATDGAGDKFSTSCGGREDTQSNPDRVYRLELSARAHVSLTLTTPSWDGVLVLRRGCVDGAPGGAGGEVRCNNDFEDTHHAKIDMPLDAGTYYVVVDGHATGNAGSFSLEYKIVK